MRKTIVSAFAVLAALAWPTDPASAQAVRVGAAVRVSNNPSLGFYYRSPYVRWMRYHDGYRWHRVHRNGWGHRRYALRHRQYLRRLEQEHGQLHRQMYLGRVGAREHRDWHIAVGFTHDEFRYGLVRSYDRRPVRRYRPVVAYPRWPYRYPPSRIDRDRDRARHQPPRNDRDRDRGRYRPSRDNRDGDRGRDRTRRVIVRQR